MTDNHQPLRDALTADEFLTANVAKDHLRALLADLGAAVKDAERYRWLRDKGGYDEPDARDTDGHSEFSCNFWTRSYTLDAAVDAAMAIDQIKAGREKA